MDLRDFDGFDEISIVTFIFKMLTVNTKVISSDLPLQCESTHMNIDNGSKCNCFK